MTIVLFQVLGAFANRPFDANRADPNIGVGDVSRVCVCVCVCVCVRVCVCACACVRACV